jgi:hypothetical protein
MRNAMAKDATEIRAAGFDRPDRAVAEVSSLFQIPIR